jgi:hypothetical protein
MANSRTRTISTSFSSGEISPRLLGRTDLRQHAEALRECLNFQVHRQGGASYRAGTRHVALTKDNGRARLIPFRFSTVQQYALEFGDEYIRFFKNGGSGNPTQIEESPGVPTEIESPWNFSRISFIKFAQSADVMWLCHPEVQPHTLARVGTDDTLPASWVLAPFNTIDGPYGPINDTATTITPTPASGTVSLAASAPLFEPEDVGRWVRLQHGSTWGWAQITVFTNDMLVTAVTSSDFGAATPTDVWRLGAWRGTNWPSVVTIHQGRLWFAATPEEPQTVWSSNTDDYNNFSPSDATGTATDDMAITRTISDSEVNAIDWLVSDRTGLVALTSDGAFVISAGNDAALTPSNATARRNSTSPSHPTCAPARVGSAIVFWQRIRYLREHAWTLDSDRLDGPDLTIQSDHIGLARPVEAAWVDVPDSMLWSCMEDGSIASVTYERSQRVVGWHRHSIADGRVVSVCSIKAADRDELWMIVRRSPMAGGDPRGDEHGIEVMQRQVEDASEESHAAAWHLDAAVRMTGTNTTFGGLFHLSGSTVGATVNGATMPTMVVDDAGDVTFDEEVTDPLVGLPYVGKFTTAPLTPNVPYESRGVFRRAFKLFIQVYASLGGKCSTNGGKSHPIQWRRVGDPMEDPPPLFSGVVEISVQGNSDRQYDVTITQEDPQPLHVLSIATETEVGDA